MRTRRWRTTVTKRMPLCLPSGSGSSTTCHGVCRVLRMGGRVVSLAMPEACHEWGRASRLHDAGLVRLRLRYLRLYKGNFSEMSVRSRI